MNINPFGVQAPDSVESILENAAASCARFNHGTGLFVGHYMAIGRLDGAVSVCAVETRGLLRYLEGHVKVVTSVSWSPNNRYLASSSLDWNVIIWDLHGQGSQRKTTVRFDAPVIGVEFSPVSSQLLVVTLQTQEAILVDLRLRRKRRKAVLDNGSASGNGSALGNGIAREAHDLSEDSEIIEQRYPLTLTKAKESEENQPTQAPGILSATFAKNGKALVLGSSKGDLFVVDVRKRSVLLNINTGSSGIRQLAFDRTGRTLVANANDRSVRLYNFQYIDETQVSIVLQHRFQDLVNRTPWSGIGFSGDGEYVFGGATHKAAHNIYIWDRGAGVLDKILQGPRDSLVDCDWHPNRPMLASVSHTGAVNIWFSPPTEIWSAYAPGFEELEENVVYEEREDEFDLEDEEEMSRRKQDEEGAQVDIVSLGPKISTAFHTQRGGLVVDQPELPAFLQPEDPSDFIYEESQDDDDDESFAISVQLSYQLPDLDGES